MVPRVFVPGLRSDLDVGETLRVGGEAHHYLARVMRLHEGDRFVVVRDRDATADSVAVLRDPFCIPVSHQEFVVHLDSTAGGEACGTIVQVNRPRVEPRVRVTLVQALARGTHFEYAVQKCTELGCFDIVPLETERSEVRLSTQRERKRLERWRRIAREAAEQSQRMHRPIIHPVMNLLELTNVLGPGVGEHELRIVPWEEERNRGLRAASVPANATITRALLIIGPEGGLSAGEIDHARRAGFVPVTLGPRILRTETAGAAALTMLLYQLGDLGGGI